MDIWMYTPFVLWPLIGFVVIKWVESLTRKQREKRVWKLPPGPKPWPIIGNLHLLAGKLPHQDLAKLSHHYGPLLYLTLGSKPTVVASSVKWAREFLQTHDKVFGNRADRALIKGVALGSTAFSPTGEYWRQMRKIAGLELLSPKKIEACQGLRLEEIRKAIAEIASKKEEAVSFRKVTTKILSGLVSGLLFSSTLSETTTQLMAMTEVICNAPGRLMISDFLPYLGFLDILTNLGLTRVMATRDPLMREMFTLRRSQYDKLHPQCLLDVLLDLQQQHSLVDNREKVLYGFLQDLIVGGIDTTSSMVEWAMAELMRNPKKLKKVMEEMKSEVVIFKGDIGNDLLEDKEVARMRYLHAVLKETLRLHPPIPFLLTRESMEQCVVGEENYELPKGVLLYINVWKIGRDPNVWENPQEFIPERFLMDDNKEGTNWQQDEEHGLLAFGGGRRGCPGKSLGLSTAKMVLANLLYAFEWNMGNDSSTLVDMAEQLGISTLKKNTPLMLIPTPRNFATSSNQN